METKTRTEIEILENPDQAARAAADRIVASARAAIAARGKFTLALTGGSTPEATYSILAAEHGRALSWKKVHFFLGDERLVPYEDPRSNYGVARATWLGGLGLPAEVLHPMPVDLEDDAAARSYE